VKELRDWKVDRGDIRADPVIAREILEFMEKHGVLSVAMTDAIIGCSHQQGIELRRAEGPLIFREICAGRPRPRHCRIVSPPHVDAAAAASRKRLATMVDAGEMPTKLVKTTERIGCGSGSCCWRRMVWQAGRLAARHRIGESRHAACRPENNGPRCAMACGEFVEVGSPSRKNSSPPQACGSFFPLI
jgi:hypothetical protein